MSFDNAESTIYTFNSQHSSFTSASKAMQQPDIFFNENPRCNSVERINRKSRIWNYFTRLNISSDGKTRKIKCKLPGCGKEFIYGNSPSTLRYHLRHHHNIVVNSNQIKLAQGHTTSHKRSKKNTSSVTEDLDFYRFIELEKFRYHTSGVIDSQTTYFYNQLCPILKNLLRDVKSVSLAIESFKIESYEHVRITCHWLSDDFQLHKILLDIIPIPKFFDIDEIFKSIKGFWDAWELNDKVISTTMGQDLDYRVICAIDRFKDIAYLDCALDIGSVSINITKPVSVFCEDLYYDFSEEGIEEEVNHIIEEVKKICNDAKNSEELIIYLVRHEHEFLKEALQGRNWISSLMPDTKIIKYFDNLSPYSKILKNAMQNLDDAKYTLYTLKIEFSSLRQHIQEYEQKFEEHLKQKPPFLVEIFTVYFIKEIEFILSEIFGHIHYKIAFFDPHTKKALEDEDEMDGVYLEIDSEYLDLCEKTQNTPTNIDEFDRYVTLTLNNPNERIDPIEWWRRHKNELPVMAKLAQKYLSIPVTCHSFNECNKKMGASLKSIIDNSSNFEMAKRYEFLKQNINYLC
ncbi:14156_t:CDS:2 [Acaulospora morrowiae]|uniref:14156_t:CDS:1 n=1 Tax=Acaulospora morrowiae TaxID=94023 RepID=A0A9N9FWH4_9GLOM|nr:14156_t:CDS:2 [Acaulospora morrowiae]